jgi:hypothetical protein
MRWMPLIACLVLAGCGGEADSLEGTRAVRGELVLGIETRVLQPCGIGELWWSTRDPFIDDGTIFGWGVVRRAILEKCPNGIPDCGQIELYLEGTADVSAKGRRGYLERYDRTVEFKSIDRVLGAPPTDCALAP